MKQFKIELYNKEFIITKDKDGYFIMPYELEKFNGFNLALKPSIEPICVARKPLSEGTVADNVLKWGTGGINIDGCRVGSEVRTTPINSIDEKEKEEKLFDTLHTHIQRERVETNQGRFPANFIHDGSEEVTSLFPETKSGKMTSKHNRTTDGSKNGIYGKFDINHPLSETYGDSGNASRFFYCAKANKKDRNDGLLNKNKEILSWENVDLSLELMELNQLKKDISEDIIQNLEKQDLNMLLFGKENLEQYQMDIKFIIKMVLKLIIELKTLNASVHLNIKENTLGVIKMIMENGLNLVENVENISLLKQNITNEKMELVLGVSLAVLKMLLKIKEKGKQGNIHSTVKPTDLMAYLCRLVTPPNGLVLDPFNGSGSTGKACMRENFRYIGIDLSQEYLDISKARIEYELSKKTK